MSLELLLDAKATLGEGPSWDEDRHRLIWVDIWGEAVHIYDPATRTDQKIDVGQPVGAAVPSENGAIIAALKNGFYSLQPDTAKLTFLCDPERDKPDNRFNDGKCDAIGRFWAGTMRMEEDIPDQGALYCLHSNGQVTKAVQDVSTSNGIAWSPDQTTMYYIDSPTRRVDAFDFDLASGALHNRRTIIRIPEGGGYPDGMTSDTEGMLWIAQWDGYQVSRWNPSTGELLQTIQVPAPRVTSCVFGGSQLNELYITTARTGLSQELLAKYPLSGGLFRIQTEVKGMPTYTYRTD